jgi:hypothetical protein
MTAPPCTCVADRRAKLAADNTELVLTWCSDTRQVTPTIAAREIHVAGREAVIVVPTHCPFCGLPYAASAEEDPS